MKGRPNFEYHVQWTGSGSDLATWEPERNLKNASQVVQTYWDNLHAQGMKVPWSKPKFVGAVEVAQRRGRVAGALAPEASTTHRPVPPSRKRRIRRQKGLPETRAIGLSTDLWVSPLHYVHA